MRLVVLNFLKRRLNMPIFLLLVILCGYYNYNCCFWFDFCWWYADIKIRYLVVQWK